MATSPPTAPTDSNRSDNGRSLADRSVDRALAERQAAYEHEVTRLIDSTYAVMARSGDLSPTVREILAEAGLSNQAFYRHFRSKDELLLVVLDDGRRKLVDCLSRRMARADGPVGRIEEWIRGVMNQAADADAAARTRPFVADVGRLVEQFPDEQRTSEQLLIDLLAQAILDGASEGLVTPLDPTRDAAAIYGVTFGAMEAHVRADSRPGSAEIEHLAAGADPVGA